MYNEGDTLYTEQLADLLREYGTQLHQFPELTHLALDNLADALESGKVRVR